MHPKVRVGFLIIEEGRLLLVQHKKGGRSYWLPPGGGLRWGETLQECAQREAEEELGVKIELLEPIILCDSISPEGNRHIIHLLFFAKILEGSPKARKDGVLEDAGFFGKEELEGMLIYPAGIREKLFHLLKGDRAFEYLGNCWG
jgi:ADP-ribose pyrophosphatase YjhB (NUDIX family)